MTETATMTMGFHASDVTGNKRVRATSPTHTTIGELVQRLVAKMGLSRTDRDGGPLAYQARLDREGRHLHGAEMVGDALQEDDEIVLHPSIEAGAGGEG